MADRRILGVLPLRGTVLFPGPGVTLSVGRPGSLKSIEAAAKADRMVFAVTQRDEAEEARVDNLYTMGVIAKMGQIQPGVGSVQIAVTGEQRGTAVDYRMGPGGMLTAVVLAVPEVPALDPNDAAFRALYREVRDQARELGVRRGLPEEVLQRVIESVTEPGSFADVVATFLELPVAEKQALLESVSVEVRLRRLLVHMQRQIQLLQTQEQIKNQVAEEIGGRQRELYLREQLKAIQKELGEGADDDPGLTELRQKLARLELPAEARAEVDRELARFERSGRESMEAQVIRTYLQWISELPWNTRSDDNLDLARAAQVLDEDHYGLKDVKDRVLEFLSVRLLKARALAAAEQKKEAVVTNGHGGNGEPAPATVIETKARAVAHGPILLFVGPPGVGKTSIAQSVARALGRKYVRVSLGGARDEADIRGHRRTYVGALPGRIIHGMKQAGTQNPVFLLDEVDKLGVSFQGDPAAALLEVLDPAQNNTFTDHYLGVPFDLSEVLFIATGNYLHNIPGPLLDRTELVEFAGYTEREKAEIAKRYLIPRQLSESGLVEAAAEPGYTFTDEAIAVLVSNYTRESGVRQLEREVGAVARKLARKIAIGEPVTQQITAELVRELLGRPRVRPEHAGEADEVGVATGLYYSPAGGDIMFVEAAVRRRYARAFGGDGDTELGDVAVILTGQLGEVMKESARAAVTYATTRAAALHIPKKWLGSIEVHVHVPAGAIPKDGPSAGVAIVTAVVSAMSGRAVRKDVAMTGEITLRGHVLPIGGLKEKVLGAHRAGIRRVILPKANEPDLEDVPREVREALEFHPVTHLDEIFEIALLEKPEAREQEFPEADAAPLG